MEAIDLTAVKALTFDCYGTLVDWEAGILAVLRPWAARQGVKADDDALLSAFGSAEPACERETPRAPYPEILKGAMARIAISFTREPDPRAAEDLSASVGAWPPFPDTREALRRLSSRFVLAVVSNVDRGSFAATQRRLGHAFGAVITAEEVGVYKPDHRMFLRAFEVLEGKAIDRKAIVHVAQSLYHDHAPAKELGMRTVWIDRRAGKTSPGATPAAPPGVRPDWTCRTLAELADRIAPPI